MPPLQIAKEAYKEQLDSYWKCPYRQNPQLTFRSKLMLKFVDVGEKSKLSEE